MEIILIPWTAEICRRQAQSGHSEFLAPDCVGDMGAPAQTCEMPLA